MAGELLIGSILSIAAIILIVVVLHYSGGMGVISEIFSWIRDTLSWLMQHKLFMYLFIFFLITTIVPSVMSIFLGMNFACLGDEERQYNYAIIGGLGGYMTAIGETGNTTEAYDAYILNNTKEMEDIQQGDVRSAVSVRCLNNSPKLTFFGLNMFDYRYWALIYIIGALGIVFMKKRLG